MHIPTSFSFFFFLMIRRPPRSTLDRSSAASDVYKRQDIDMDINEGKVISFSISGDSGRAFFLEDMKKRQYLGMIY